VGFELSLAGSSGADAAAETLEVSPLPDQTREQIRELSQLDLELSFRGARALGEDVEDQRRAVDHLEAKRLREVALLHRRQRIVADHEARACSAARLCELVLLATSHDPCG